MDHLRPRTSRLRRRPEPMIAIHLSEETNLGEGTAREVDSSYSKVSRPQTASFKPSRSQPSSGVRAEEKRYGEGTAKGLDPSYSNVARPQTASFKPSRSRHSSGVRAEEKRHGDGTARGVDSSYSNVARPQTAFFKPSRSRHSSGVRAEEKGHGEGTAKGVDSSYSNVARPQTASFKPSRSRHSSGVRAEEKGHGEGTANGVDSSYSNVARPQTASFKPSRSRHSSGVRAEEKGHGEGTANGVDSSYSNVARPQTASFKPSRSRHSSGVRAEEKGHGEGTAKGVDSSDSNMVRPQTAFINPPRYLPSSVRGDRKLLSPVPSGSSEAETDTETIKAYSPKRSSSRITLRRSPSGVRSAQEKENDYSQLSSSGTETDTETLRPISPNRYESNPTEPVTYTNALMDYEDAKVYSSDFESDDDRATVISAGSGSKRSPPDTPMEYSDVRPIEIAKGYSSSAESDGAETVVSMAPKKKRSSSHVRHQMDDAETVVPMDPRKERCPSGVPSKVCLRDEAPKVPMLNLDEEEAAEPLEHLKVRSSSGVPSERSSRKEYHKAPTLNLDDAEKFVPKDQRKKRTPSGVRSQICLRDEAPKVPVMNLDDADRRKKRSPSGVRSKTCLRDEAVKNPMLNTEDAERRGPMPSQMTKKDEGSKVHSKGSKTHTSMAPRKKESCSMVRSRMCSKSEKPKVPMLDLDDLESVSGQSVLLKSAHGCTDLKNEIRRRGASVSRLTEELKQLTLKNMLFFPSKNLTRPSIEEIYGPKKKRSQSLRRGGNTLRSGSNNSVDRTIQKKLQELDTARPAAMKEEESCDPAVKMNEPKILAPLLIGRIRTDKRTDRYRQVGPVKPKPFNASGCGKGIPSLDKLPKPKIGVLPAYLLNKKNESGAVNMKSTSLSVLENNELKPAIPGAVLRNINQPGTSKSSKSVAVPNKSRSNTNNRNIDNSLFIRNRIPLRKPGTKSTSNLISTIPKPKKRTVELKPKKSVSFDLRPPPKTQPAGDEEQRDEEQRNEEQRDEEQIEEEPLPNSTYRDPCKQNFQGVMEKAPIFDDGPLPITTPSPIYQNLLKLGWDYSRFTPKNYVAPVPMIPYDFLNQYLHVFDNLERAAVHTKYGTVTECTCLQASTSTDFCEKHIESSKLQFYKEATEVMIALLSFRYEVPEYDKAEKMLEEFYPYIYQGWVMKTHLRLSMDFRVREAKCKYELVQSCIRVLEEEDLLAEFLQSEEIIGGRRDISISGRMKDIEDDFELSYIFLFTEYPHLFIQLVERIEFIPLALERKIIATFRKQIVAKANLPEEKLQEEEESYREKLEKEEEAQE